MLIGFKTEGCIVCSYEDSHQKFHFAFALTLLVFLLLTGPELIVNWWNTHSEPYSFSTHSNFAFKMAIDSMFNSPAKTLIMLTTFEIIDTVEFMAPLFNVSSKLTLDPHYKDATFWSTAIYLFILPNVALNLVARNCQIDPYYTTHSIAITDTSGTTIPM